MSVDLKIHNEKAYQNVVKMFDNGNRAAVIHPTGTGKSFIAIKLMEENVESRILYLAPYKPILYQLKEKILEIENGKMFGNVSRMTYAKLSILSNSELDDLKPDIIVLDEFHHCGSEVWGEAVNKLIEKNLNAKIYTKTNSAPFYKIIGDIYRNICYNNIIKHHIIC